MSKLQFFIKFPIFQTVSGKLNWPHYLPSLDELKSKLENLLEGAESE